MPLWYDDADPAMDPCVWRRHRALSSLVRAWPQLEAEVPPSRAMLAGWLERSGSRLHVVAPAEAPDGYETAVENGAIPTREGSWHDTFNVLSFIAFPRAKPALHRRALALQRARKAAGQPTGVRSREEDALALIDEGSLVFAGSPAAIAALDEARRGGSESLAPIAEAIQAHEIAVRTLGHALLEHLVLGRAPIGAGVVTLAVVDPISPAAIDRALAHQIASGGFPTPRFSPNVPWPDPCVDSWIT